MMTIPYSQDPKRRLPSTYQYIPESFPLVGMRMAKAFQSRCPQGTDHLNLPSTGAEAGGSSYSSCFSPCVSWSDES
jgi:hypothetical protein